MSLINMFGDKWSKRKEQPVQPTKEESKYEHIPGWKTIGLCPLCGYRVPLKKDGTITSHAYFKQPCSGVNKRPTKIVASYPYRSKR